MQEVTRQHSEQKWSLDAVEPKTEVQKEIMHNPIMQDTNMFSCPHGGRNMHLTINLILLTSSLFLMGVGSGLMGFYRIHLLEVISVDFLLVPLFLILGGLLTLFTALFGFYAGSREVFFVHFLFIFL